MTAYLLTSTASTPLYGKLSDLYGRKQMFQLAIAIFLVGSALAGLAQNMTQLVAFRAVQGLGAGGLISMAMAIIGEVVSPGSAAATRAGWAPCSGSRAWPGRWSAGC